MKTMSQCTNIYLQNYFILFFSPWNVSVRLLQKDMLKISPELFHRAHGSKNHGVFDVLFLLYQTIMTHSNKSGEPVCVCVVKVELSWLQNEAESPRASSSPLSGTSLQVCLSTPGDSGARLPAHGRLIINLLCLPDRLIISSYLCAFWILACSP